MIPQITEINFPSYATLNSATITLSEMGDRNITTQIKIDGDIVPDFSGWELEFKGERFILPVKEPQAAKDTTSRRSIVDLTFSSWAVQEMKRYFFVEMTSIESGTAIADKYKASLGLNIENFVTAFNNVLNYYFNGKIEMDLFGSGTGIYSAEPAFFEIDYTHIWDVLQKIYEIYEVRWTITYDSSTEKYVIKVGYPAAEIDDHDFEYGYQGGLLRFERQVQDYDITNVLLGRGGEKNLPYRYFKKVDPQNPNWAGDPDAIPELKNIYFENLRDINFRRYVQGWKTNPNRILEEGDVVETYDSARGETDFAYAKGHTDERFNPVEYVKDDASIAIYGERWGALDNADDIYPTIQGIEVDPYGRIDQVVDVEDVTTDDIEAMAADAAEVMNLKGSLKTEWINSNSTLVLDINGADFTVPEGKIGNLATVGTWVDTLSYGKKQSPIPFQSDIQSTISAEDPVRNLVTIDTVQSYIVAVNKSTSIEVPASAIPAGSYYYKLHIVVKSEFESSMYKSVEVTVGVDGLKLTTSEGNANAWKPTFDIWVKNIWNTTQQSGESDEQYAARVWEPILGDRTGEEAKIAFSTGFLSLSEDYNFTIASIPVVDRTKTIDGVASEWRITLVKSDAEYEATGKYIPNAETGGNASAGDYFFFTGIDMPWAYVLWAEEKLNAYKTAELAKLKQINPTWIIRIDKVRANTKEQGELEYLADRFASGAKLRVRDKRFTNNQVLTLYVQTVTYTWQEPSNGNPYLVPDIEVVLSDKVETVASPIDQLEGSVDLIQSTYAKISDIESAIRRVASPIFLKKTGESERSLSPTRFSSLMASESFRQGDIGGQGWGAYTDGEGHSVLEADTIVVRKDMRVNTLTVNQIAYLGGKQIISAAAMECNRVEVVDGGYKCYFDQKQGSVANLFKVDDVVLGQVWNADESELRYYKRKVIAIDSDSITLSSTIADGTGIPQPKDVLVQYGSYSDTSRQYVIVRDVIGGGYERMLSGLTTVFSNGEEYYFAGRQDGSTPRWFVGDANGQHASYQDGVLNITGRLSVTTQVDKGNGTYESLSNYLSNLQDQIDGNIQTWYATGEPTLQNYPANTWPTVEDKNNHIGDLYYESETGKAYRFMLDGNTYKWVQIADEDIAAALALAQQNQTAIAGLAYLKAATNQGTLVQGGLVLTSMIQLGQTEEGVYKVYSGINGIMDTSALGNGIAAWYGGPMADIGADSTLTDFAKSLFRFDGSGYLASGNIKWDLNGNGEIPGISWNNGRITLSPDIYLQGGDRLTQIVDAVNRMYTQFAYDSHDNITVAPTHALYIPTTSPAYPIEGKVALYYDYNGNYSELPSGGVGEVFELTLRNGATLLGIFQPGVEDKTIDLSPMLSGYATQSWVSANFNKYVLPTASASVLGGIKIGTGLTIDATGVVSVTGQTQGTVTRVDLGTTQYSPNDSGVVTLPSYPTTLPASDVSAWAKKTSLEASDVPTLAISKISGLQDALDGKQPLDADLTAIAALTSSGLLRRNSNNTWSLDTNTYLTSSDHKALTLKVGTITIGSDFNSLAAKTYTITKANLTDTIGDTTYAPYNADGYVPTTRTVNGHPLSSDVTVTKGDVGLGNVENTALSTWAGSNNITTLGTITTGVWHGSKIANAYLANSSVTINGKSVSLGGSISLNLDDIGDGTSKTWDGIVFTDTVQTITGKKTMTNVSVTDYLAVPKIAPASPVTGDIYLWADADGNYSEIPGGGGVADIYDLTLRKNGTSLGTYNLGTAAADINIPIGWADLTEDSSHKFVSQSEKDTWSAKMSKMQAIPYIEGSRHDVAGTWTGTYEGITAYEDGLTIIYVPNIPGASGRTTLNINSLGAKICYLNGMIMTTQYGSGMPLLLTYYNNGWHITDMDTTYSAGTKALFDAGANTTNRVWSAKVLADSVAPKVHTHTWSDITDGADVLSGYLPISGGELIGNLSMGRNAIINIGSLSAPTDETFSISGVQSISFAIGGAFLPLPGIVKDGNHLVFYTGYADVHDTVGEDLYHLKLTAAEEGSGEDWGGGSYKIYDESNLSLATLAGSSAIGSTSQPVYYNGSALAACNLGTASQKDAVTSISSGGAGLPTAGAIYTFVNNAVTAAQPYKGVSSTAVTDGGTEMPTISGYTTRTKGDVVAYNKKEFIWEGDKWRELGDEGSYALKTVQVVAGTGLAGGGAISQDVTLSLSSETIASLGLADTALQASDLDGYVNAISQGTGNYVTGITKSGKTLTITRATLPTTIALSNVTGADDLKAIEALTGTSGLLKKTAANTWSLDTNTYLTSASHKALTLKVGNITIGSDYNSLAAKTYTISKANLTDTIGSTTYAPYNADGYLPLSGGTLTGALIGTTITTSGDVQVDGDFHADGNIESDSNVLGYGVRASALLAIPTAAPTTIVSGEVYLWADEDGNYAETAGGGGSATVYDLTIRKNGTSLGTVNLGEQAGNINIPVGWSDLTPDASHRFLTDSLISTWNGKYTKPATGIPKTDLASAVQTTLTNADTAYGWGNHADAGYLTSFTETDPTVPAWAKATSKPTYTLDEVADGSTRKLSDYLPLSAGSGKALTGDLYMDCSAASRGIWWKDGSNNILNAFRLEKSGQLNIGYNLLANSKSTQIIGASLMLAFGSSSTPYSIIATATGPSFRPTVDDTILLGNNSYKWKALYATTLYGNLDWSYIQNKPTLDNIADGATRKLSNYLPLTGGTLTGGLTLSNVNQVFDVSTATRSIYYKASDAVSYRGIMFGTNGDLTIGYDGPAHSRSLYLDGFNEYLRFGSTKQYSVKLNSTGTVELGGISAVLPVTTNEVNLGSSAKAFNNIYGKLDLSYVQSASDLKAIEALTGTGLAKRTADNTWELTDTADKAEELATSTEEDAMFTYRQVPSEAVGDVLKATAVKGRSIVWNQLVQNGDFSNGVTEWKTSRATIETVSGGVKIVADGTSAAFVYQELVFTMGNTHKYFLKAVVELAQAGRVSFSNWNSDTGLTQVQANVLTEISVVWTPNVTNANGRRCCLALRSLTTNNPAAGDSMTVHSFEAIDLTAAGLDDLTAAEFEALYPDYHAYNAGELVNNAASGVEMLGFNRWDEQWENGTFNTTTGENLAVQNQIRSKNLIPVQGGQTYYLNSSNSVWVMLLDVNQSIIDAHTLATDGIGSGKSFAWNNRSVTLPAEVAYMKFYLVVSYGSTYNHDICINISDPSLNGQYKPYKTSTLSTPITEIVPADKPTVRLVQIVKNGNFDTVDDWTTGNARTVANNILTVTKGVAGGGLLGVSQTVPFTQGHKYFIRFEMRLTTSQTVGVRPGYVASPTIWFSTVNETPSNYASWRHNAYIVNVTGAQTTLNIGAYPASGSWAVGDKCELANVGLFDLTAMYGAGNEPTLTAEVEELIGSEYIPYNTGEYIPNRIFPVGMKSAGSVADEWSGTTAVKRIKKLVVSASNTVANNNVGNSHERQYIVFSDAVAPAGSVVGNIICAKYSAATANETYSHSRDKIIAVSSSYLYIYDSELIGKTAAEVKEALLGLEILYETKTPVTYTTDQPLPDTLVPFESGGTQRRLPVDTTSEVIAPMVCNFQYGANMSDVAKAYLPLSGGTVTGTLEAAGELIIPDSAPRNPDSTKVYLYCDTTGNYYTE